MTIHQKIEQLESEISPLKAQLLAHPLYKTVRSVEDFRCFMEQHVFAVWDFMCLLKSLQRELTCVEVPWKPVGNANTRRFINEIVLGEESDVDEKGIVISHYELYLSAMKEIGANTEQMDKFYQLVCSGVSVKTALKQININKETTDFVIFTMDIVGSGDAHKIASVFTFGREDLIPEMFLKIVKELRSQGHGNLGTLEYYLQRHIDIDGDEHGPISLKMVSELCGNDEKKWEDCIFVAKMALQHRIKLWNGILLNLVQPIAI
ncbi:MAG: DUF3050 domain-containing protein [Bacteroidetes bacterium]|nr:DUF3050 domain-containing protein [Bacteroidota bacterium]